MTKIIVNFSGRAEFDSEEPSFRVMLRCERCTLEEFLNDPKKVMHYIVFAEKQTSIALKYPRCDTTNGDEK